MIRILSYSTQLSSHLRVREALKGMENSISGTKENIKIDSIFSIDIIPHFIHQAHDEGQPIHLIIYNEEITAEVIGLLPDEFPIICTQESRESLNHAKMPKDLIFFQSLDDTEAFLYLTDKCLQMQLLREELSRVQSSVYEKCISRANFLEILGDNLNWSFVMHSHLGLVLFKFIVYGRHQQQSTKISQLRHHYYAHIKSLFPSTWKFYIFGNSELGLIVDNIESVQAFDTQLHRLHHETSVFFSSHNVVLSIDMGVAMSSGDIVDPKELYDQAKTALSFANRKGHGFIEYYGEEQERSLLFSTRVESDLKQTLRDRKLNVVYQPLVDLSTGGTVGVEALVRWNHPTFGQISPVEFLPIVERIDGLNELADIVFHQACQHLRTWKNQNINLSLSLNIAGQQLTSGNLIDHLMEITQLYNISPRDIELEVTEDFDLNYIDPLVYQLEALKSLGFKIAIDDFGVGYSSLHYLSQFPVDKIKIDRSFIYNLNEKKVKILQAIYNLAEFMKTETLVEGIETPRQVEMLKLIGIKYGQGYLFSPPLHEDKLQQYLKAA
ncbi:putative bifunctional diguanylate cyclase/phosphodiesterase [Candidatus Odyssella thessalonicensis]|uniref:putative bifunctional diguanylate cyclase/phosphodiesterase n=1 Tax=Candidatus Odyssella thessalonicensis TaxID=84647 RepID=UPI000225BED3|nr:EAL domain-containing protein [Candidatus Odyssella thessalonicensis]